MPLSRDAFLGARPELRREEIPVPELGGSVYVRVMTGTERDAYEISISKARIPNYRALLTCYTACDGEGNRLFSEADLPLLGSFPSTVLDPIAARAVQLNHFSSAAIEDLRKNSESSPSGASS